jgi:hypothetical protein
MKIRPVEGEFFHADGQTDMTKLIVDFRNSANAPNNAYNHTRVTLMSFISYMHPPQMIFTTD